MVRTHWWQVLLFLCCLGGCASQQIPLDQYSLLETPKETVAFAKKSVAQDDPDAFYYCLAEYLKENISRSDLNLAWGLGGKFFGLFLTAEVKNVEIPAPDLRKRQDLETAKVTIQLNGLEASFLFLREEEKWKIANPNHYKLPDISQLETRGRLPWRNGKRVYYQQTPSDWLSDKGKESPRDFQKKLRRPTGRTPDENQSPTGHRFVIASRKKSLD